MTRHLAAVPDNAGTAVDMYLRATILRCFAADIISGKITWNPATGEFVKTSTGDRDWLTEARRQQADAVTPIPIAVAAAAATSANQLAGMRLAVAFHDVDEPDAIVLFGIADDGVEAWECTCITARVFRPLGICPHIAQTHRLAVYDDPPAALMNLTDSDLDAIISASDRWELE